MANVFSVREVCIVSRRTSWSLVRWLLLVVLCGGLVTGVYRFAPRAISERISGVQFHLGTNQAIRKVTIAMRGSWRYTLDGLRRFHGTIGIYGPHEANPYDYEHRTITMTMYPYGGGALMWVGSRGGEGFIFTYGALYASRDFGQIAILATTNGTIVAGPATTRAAGLRVSNQLIAISPTVAHDGRM